MRGVLATALAVCLPAIVFGVPADATAQATAACAIRPPGGQWTAAAQWIAGLNDNAFSSTLTPEQHAAWAAFSKLSASDWANLKRQYLDRIDIWRNRNLVDLPSRETAFYPFGGPDAANLLAFFPDARDYIMVGLEPVGCIPSNISGYTPDYFTALRHSLSSVVALGFFKTDDMRRDVTQSDLNGVLPLLLFLISRDGYTVTDVTPIGISPTGVVAPTASLPVPLVNGVTSGVAIQFNDARHGARTLRYFSLNLENSRLKRNAGATAFLKSLPDMMTLTKAASYLMHKPYFSTIRATILSKSRVVVEEDSGIPYHYFEPATWDVRLFGIYAEPIQLFKDWNQDDLKAAYAAAPNAPQLDFAIGYRHRGQSNLIVAVRKK